MTDTVKFADGVNLNLSAHGDLGWGMDLVQATLKFVSRVRKLCMDRAEFCMLNAIVLTYPGIYNTTAFFILHVWMLPNHENAISMRSHRNLQV